MNKVGIITYHSAYNYGSVLQAYATQVAVKKLGFDAEIINYRMSRCTGDCDGICCCLSLGYIAF